MRSRATLQSVPTGRDTGGDRYEPLPSIPELPGWIWRRLPRPARIVVALIPVAAVVLYLVLSPGISRDKDERARAEAEHQAQFRADHLATLRAEARPRTGTATGLAAASAPAAQQIAAREDAVDQMADAVMRDAHARDLPGDVSRIDCEAFPRTVAFSGAERDLGRRSGRYSCIAVTADVRGGDTQGRGVIGHPYRAMIDFETGRYAFCKVSGRPGEGLLAREHATGVPAACGGRE